MATGLDKAREAGLTLRSNDYRQPCPQCSPHRRKKKDPCLHVTVDGARVQACCFHCDWGMIFEDDDSRAPVIAGARAQNARTPERRRWW